MSYQNSVITYFTLNYYPVVLQLVVVILEAKAMVLTYIVRYLSCAHADFCLCIGAKIIRRY